MFKSLVILSVLCLSSALAFKILNDSDGARIVGGRFTKIEKFPHQISFRVHGEHNCGGSILSAKYILTAAHCCAYENGQAVKPFSIFSVLAGSSNINDEKAGVLRKVKNIVIHKDWQLNDLAILELDQPLNFSDKIQPIELMTKRVPLGGQVDISGWGKVSNSSNVSSPLLKYNTLTALSPQVCRKVDMGKDEFMCLNHFRGNGACQGDSGGPATYEGKLAGVASFIIYMCGGPLPDVYVNVSHYVDWIKEHSDI